MPVRSTDYYRSYYNPSPECWGVYAEVLGVEFSNAMLFGQVHQLTVDTYAVQHAGGNHKDKSIAIHLSGLYLVLEQDIPPATAPKLLQRLAEAVEVWPHFLPPADLGSVTVCDVALCDTIEEHIRTVREWDQLVWRAWSPCHSDVEYLVSHHLVMRS